MKPSSFSAEAIAQSAVTAYERSLGENKPDEVPPGFRTSREWSEIWGKGESQTRAKIRENIRKGSMVTEAYSIPTFSGALHKTPHYKAVK